MKKILIIGLLILAICSIGCVKGKASEVCNFVGIVDDFEVSAGGFGECDLATVAFKSGDKLVIKCNVVERLVTNIDIYKCGSHYYVGDDYVY